MVTNMLRLKRESHSKYTRATRAFKNYKSQAQKVKLAMLLLSVVKAGVNAKEKVGRRESLGALKTALSSLEDLATIGRIIREQRNARL